MPEHIPADIYARTYGANLQRGERQGLILYANTETAASDEYTHLPTSRLKGGIFRDNTRPLSPAAHTLVRAMARHGEYTYLEAGSGAGRSAFEAFCIGRKQKTRAHIHTVSLSPIDPFSGLTGTAAEIHRKLKRILDDPPPECDEGIQRRISELDANSLLPLDLLLSVQATCRRRIFETLKRPWVERQYIGDFPEDIQLPENRYDMIHDECGPSLYERDRQEVTQGSVLQALYNALKPSGVMNIRPLHLPKNTRKNPIDADDLIIGQPFPADKQTDEPLFTRFRDIVIVRPENPLAETMRPHMKRLPQVGNVHITTSMNKFMRETLAA